MEIWEKLGIEPTTDLSAIRAAYAARAKQCHPEENPEEFQALQKAYKIAAQYAKRKSSVGSQGKTEIPGDSLPLWDFKTNAPVSPTKQADETPAQGRESIFDFSGIDTYGDKERFFRQFDLIAKNPYIKNKINVWDVFLNQPAFTSFFWNNGFRTNFVRTLCGLSGWRRETILFFDRYLKRFHADGKVPENGKWETDLFCFRWQKRFRIRVPFAEKDVYASREGAEIQRRIMAVFHRRNRILDFGNKRDVRDFLAVYFPYAYACEDQIEWLYRQAQNYHAAWVGAGAVFLALTVFFLGLHWSIRGQEEAGRSRAPVAGTEREKHKAEEAYLRWLKGWYTEPGLRTDSEKEEKVQDAMEDALERYETWKYRDAEEDPAS